MCRETINTTASWALVKSFSVIAVGQCGRGARILPQTVWEVACSGRGFSGER